MESGFYFPTYKLAGLLADSTLFLNASTTPGAPMDAESSRIAPLRIRQRPAARHGRRRRLPALLPRRPKTGSERERHYPIICAPARAGRRKRDNEKSIFKRRNPASNRGRIPASIRGRIPAPNINLLIRPRIGKPDSGLKSRPDSGNIKRILELSRPTFRRVLSGSLAVQSPNFWRLGAHLIRH